MKKTAMLLTFLLITASVTLAGCGRLDPNPDTPMPRVVSHPLDVRFDNCNVCHVNDQLSVTTIDHSDFTNGSCTMTGCHGKRVYTEPNTSASSRPIPHIVTSPLNDCIACHLPSQTGNIIPHSMYTDNSLCLTPACHVAATPPPAPTEPPPTNTATPTTDSPVTTDPPGGGDAPVLEGNPGALPAAHAVYAGMCAACHNDNPTDPNQYPVAPTWKGSVKSPGPWTVVAGSPADHTGRTDSAGCVVAGCHG